MGKSIFGRTNRERIFFDHRWAGSGGIGRFGVNLRRELRESHGFDLHDVDLDGSPTDAIDPVRLTVYLRRQRATLYISPGYNVPYRSPCETIVTVHDLIHLRDAAQSSLAKQVYYRYLVAPCVRRSALTLTVSNHSQQIIVDHFDLSLDQVAVVGNGIDGRFCPSKSNRRLNSTSPYYLYVGNTKPHKNIPVLMRALTDSRLLRHRLVLACQPEPSLVAMAQRHRITDRIDWRPRLDDDALIELYQNATATILPSLMEGFGLPILEAMACDCPIIGSDRGSIPEVMGDGGILFSATEPQQLATVMHSVATDPRLRRRLIEKGRLRAQHYSWSKVGDRAALAIRTRLNPTENDRRLSRAA